MTREQIIAQVLAKIDEVSPLAQEQEFSPAGTIDAIMNESVSNMLRNAPLHLLTPVKVNTEGANFVHDTNADGTGRIALPSNFIRLYSFKMQAWSRPVEKTISVANPLYKLQHNPVTRGKSQKPVVALSYHNTGTGVDDPNIGIDPPVEGWNAIPPIYINDETIYHGSEAGQMHIPAGGELNQILAFGSPSGVAVWSAMTDSIHGNRGGGFLHDLATEQTHGFMSSYDKAKLNTIQQGANYYEHPNQQGFKHIPQGGQVKDMLVWSAPGTAVWIDPATILELKIEQGDENEFLSWDKTWRQIDYSMLTGDISFNDLSDVTDYTVEDAGKFVKVNSGGTGLEYATVNVDLSNYVTLNTTQSITGQKSFQQIANFPSIGLTYGSTYKTVIQASTLTGNTLFQLPPNNGTNGYVLTTNGSGVTSWTSVSQHWTLVSSSPVNHIIHTGAVVIGSGTPTLSNTTGQLHIIGNTDNLNTVAFLVTSSSNKQNFKIDNRGNTIVGGYLIVGRTNETVATYKARVGIRSFNSQYSSYLYAPDELAANYNLTLPTTAGTSGYVLTTDGTGVLSWSPNGSGNYNVFTLNTNGLVPGPSVQNATTFLASNGNWYTVDAGITTSLKAGTEGTPRSGGLTLIAGDAITITNSSEFAFTFAHSDTSTQGSVSNSGFSIIQSVTLDGFGHVTGLSSTTLSVFNSGTAGLVPNPGASTGKFLKDDGTWAVPPGGSGTLTSVGLTMPTGFSVSNSPLIANGSLSVSFAANYSLPLTSDTAKGVTAYGWGNHALAGYLTSYTETNPYGVESIQVTGTTTKQLSVTLRNLTVLTTTWTDLVGEPGGGDGYVSNVEWSSTSGNLTFTGIGNAFGSYVNLDGRYLRSFTESDPVFVAWQSASVGVNKYYGTNNSGAKGWYDISSGGDYTHPSYTAVNTTLSGATVLASFSSDAIGSVTGFTTRTLSYSDIGAAAASHSHNDLYYTEDEINDFFDGTTAISGYNRVNWNTAFSWGDHAAAGYLESLTSDGTDNGITIGGTAINPTLKIVSINQAGIGQITVTGSTIGVMLGTTDTTAAAGNHTHTQLHDRSHAITSTNDHTATAHRLFYSNASGQVVELAFGTNKQLLMSNGASSAPSFVNLSSLDAFTYGSKGLVPAPSATEAATETRFLCADGSWSIPTGTGTGMTNPMTTTGDIIYRSSSQSATRLGIGSVNQVLSVSSTGIPEWKTLASTFVMNITGDIVAGTDQVATLQNSAVAGKPLITSLDASDLFLVSQDDTLKSITAGNIQKYIVPFTVKGQLLYGGESGAVAVLPANTTTTRTILSQVSSNTSWLAHTFNNLNDTAVYGSGNALNLVRVNGSGTGLEYMSVAVTSASALRIDGTVLSAKLQNETAPVLGGNLNANTKSVTALAHIAPSLAAGVAAYDLGSGTNKWRVGYIDKLVTNEHIWLGNGTAGYYAGNQNGDAKYRYVEATEIRSTMIKLGTDKFAIRYNGGNLEFMFNNAVVAEMTTNGNMVFMKS